MNFTITLSLRTTRMRSQLFDRVSGVADLQTNTQTIQKHGIWQGPTLVFSVQVELKFVKSNFSGLPWHCLKK